MKVLVACEFSGIVREAFRAKCHDAWSCDLLPTEIPGQHIQGDVLAILNDGWDLMIAHPPCTHLAVSGARYFEGKEVEQELAIDFFMMLAGLDIPRICIENPVGIMSTVWRKPDQIIQPYMYGHPESKKTCLWLKNLPALEPTKICTWKRYRCRCGNVFDESLGKYGCANCGGHFVARPLWDNQTKSGQNNRTPSKTRWMDRSRTYPGIAKAMAEQWGTL